MQFSPAHKLISHQIGTGSRIIGWFHSLQTTPAPAPFLTLPLAALPEPDTPSEARPFPHGPMTVEASCPATGRALRLQVMRDMSCAILRSTGTPDAPWEVLPAALAICSEILDQAIRSIPSDERHGRVDKLRLQARPEGLRWNFMPAETGSSCTPPTLDIIHDMLACEMERVAGEIIAADPVADPRAEQFLPAGARYSAITPWPGAPADHPDIARTVTLLEDLCYLHAQRYGLLNVGFTLQRVPVDTPWRKQNRTLPLSMHPDMNKLGYAARRLLRQSGVGLPDWARFGPEGEVIARSFSVPTERSAHDQLAALSRLKKSLGGRDWTDLYIKPSATTTE